MKKTMTLALVLGVALAAAAIAQESAAKQPVAKQGAPVAKAPAKVAGPAHKPSSGQTRNKAAQVPNQVSAGNPSAASVKREGRTADGPASSEEATTDAAKKSTVKKKKSADAPAEEKAKPQS